MSRAIQPRITRRQKNSSAKDSGGGNPSDSKSKEGESDADSKNEKSADDSKPGGPEDYDAILKKYVTGDFFDYAALKENKQDLARYDAFMKWQAEADVSKMSREDAIAFYINAYNSCCIKAILDNYPVHTPNDIDGFFDKLTFKVGGEELKIGGSDGDSIEYDRLIANYKDMRAHFAVVCADRGCLPLKAGAYTGKALDADLESAAKNFIGDKRHFSVDKEKGEVQISKISRRTARSSVSRCSRRTRATASCSAWSTPWEPEPDSPWPWC